MDVIRICCSRRCDRGRIRLVAGLTPADVLYLEGSLLVTAYEERDSIMFVSRLRLSIRGLLSYSRCFFIHE